MSPDAMRIDLWLWYARFFRTRSMAARAVKSTRFRLNREIVRKTSRSVRQGDILTFPRGDEIVVVEVIGFADRRGAASEARTLYRLLQSSD